VTTTSFLNYFGTNRTFAHHVGAELTGCSHVTIPFAGGMCEVPHIAARGVLLNDAHRHVINAAAVAADPLLGPQMYRRLRRVPFSEDALRLAQKRCRERERAAELFSLSLPPAVSDADRLQWAIDYFATSWMGRGGKGGTAGEFDGPLSVRFTGTGGDSATRFRSATTSLASWRRTFRRCNFSHEDFRVTLAGVKDQPGCGVYCDPPFPVAGEAYRHPFAEGDHCDLARLLGGLRHARVVVRYYRCDLTEELYPTGLWTWTGRQGRTQANSAREDCLIVNGPSLAKEAA
jgi:site-specific DNA-adenine methylase